MLKLIKSRYFSNYYNLSPNNINEIKIMVKKVNLYLDEYLKNEKNLKKFDKKNQFINNSLYII